MRPQAWIAIASALLAEPALAQHDHHAGHPPPPAAAADPHSGHAGHQPPPPAAADPHAGHGEAPAAPPRDTPPPAPSDHAADRVFGAEAMAAARRQLRVEHGGMRYGKVMVDEFEYRPSSDPDGFAWEGEASYGGDIHRLVLRTEGEAEGGDVAAAELQALYSRAIDPYFDLRMGVRQDFEPRPRRTYAALGISGVAPYWFEVAATAFVSDRGDVSARLEGGYDLRLTQKLILAPKLELNLNAQDAPELGLGAGLSTIEAGLRLRYELRPEFAPYVGVFHEQSLGDTADLARAAGEDARDTRFVAGIRAWF